MESGHVPSRAEPVGRPADFVQSVGRAMRVLEEVGRRPCLPVKTIARHCALNISTTYHLLRTLAYEGYVARQSDGSYVIGDAVARRLHDLDRACLIADGLDSRVSATPIDVDLPVGESARSASAGGPCRR
jgi:hypothetical protein